MASSFQPVPPLAPSGTPGSGLTDSSGAPVNLLGKVVDLGNNALEILLLLAGIVAVFYVIYAGFQYLSSAGDTEKTKKARAGLVGAVTGVIIIMSAFILVRLTISASSALTANTGTTNSSQPAAGAVSVASSETLNTTYANDPLASGGTIVPNSSETEGEAEQDVLGLGATTASIAATTSAECEVSTGELYGCATAATTGSAANTVFSSTAAGSSASKAISPVAASSGCNASGNITTGCQTSTTSPDASTSVFATAAPTTTCDPELLVLSECSDPTSVQSSTTSGYCDPTTNDFCDVTSGTPAATASSNPCATLQSVLCDSQPSSSNIPGTDSTGTYQYTQSVTSDPDDTSCDPSLSDTFGTCDGNTSTTQTTSSSDSSTCEPDVTCSTLDDLSTGSASTDSDPFGITSPIF